MKLTASSSLILTTLAISSSTPSLAAPARDAYEAGLPSSQSRMNVHNHPLSSMSHHETRDAVSDGDLLVSRSALGDTLGTVVDVINTIPIVGPPLASALKPLRNLDVSDLTPETVAALQAASDELNRQFVGDQAIPVAPVPGAVKGTPVGGIAQNKPDSTSSQPSSAAASPSTNALNAAAFSYPSQPAASAAPARSGAPADSPSGDVRNSGVASGSSQSAPAASVSSAPAASSSGNAENSAAVSDPVQPASAASASGQLPASSSGTPEKSTAANDSSQPEPSASAAPSSSPFGRIDSAAANDGSSASAAPAAPSGASQAAPVSPPVPVKPPVRR